MSVKWLINFEIFMSKTKIILNIQKDTLFSLTKNIFLKNIEYLYK